MRTSTVDGWIYEVPKNIRRLDGERVHGWQVVVDRRHTEGRYTKLFSDSIYHGVDESLDAATIHLGTLSDIFDNTRTRPKVMTKLMSKNNKEHSTGIRGVSISVGRDQLAIATTTNSHHRTIQFYVGMIGRTATIKKFKTMLRRAYRNRYAYEISVNVPSKNRMAKELPIKKLNNLIERYEWTFSTN